MNRAQLEDTLAASILVAGGPEHGDIYDTVCGCDMMSELLSIMDDGNDSPGKVLRMAGKLFETGMRGC